MPCGARPFAMSVGSTFGPRDFLRVVRQCRQRRRGLRATVPSVSGHISVGRDYSQAVAIVMRKPTKRTRSRAPIGKDASAKSMSVITVGMADMLSVLLAMAGNGIEMQGVSHVGSAVDGIVRNTVATA